MTHKEQIDDLTVPSGGSLALNANVDGSDLAASVAGNGLSGGGGSSLAIASGGVGTDELDLSITPTWTGSHRFDAELNINGGGRIKRDTSHSDATFTGVTIRDWGSVNVILDRDNNDGFNRSFSVWQDGEDLANATRVLRASGFNLTLEEDQPLQWSQNAGAVSPAINIPVDGTPTTGTEQSYTMAVSGQDVAKVYAEADGSGGVQNRAFELPVGATIRDNVEFDTGSKQIIYNGGGAQLIIRDGTNGASQMTFDTGGPITLLENTVVSGANLGIGTSPSQPLDIQKTDGTTYTGTEKPSFIQIREDSAANDTFAGILMQSNAGDATLTEGFINLVAESSQNAFMAFNVERGNGVFEEKVRLGAETTVKNGNLNIASGNALEVGGTQVVGAQQSAIASLTDNTGGATDGTLAAVSGSGADTTINNNLAELNAKVDSVLSTLRTHGLIA